MEIKINIFIVLIFLFGCHNNEPKKLTQKRPIQKETFNCDKGLMTQAWYQHGQDEAIPNELIVKQGFYIIVDTNLKADNFISFYEDYSRERSLTLDTTDLSWTEDWDELTTKQKFIKVEESKKEYIIDADSAHFKNNRGQQQVWIVNNTKDRVTIQMQDWSYFCVLQAKTKNNNWYPIEYWQFSTCGNSYFFKHFPPNTANSFITELPKRGNYSTKLRFKLLGKNKYYYSNEFNGKIDYCQFVEDSTSYREDYDGNRNPHFGFDTMIHVAHDW